VRYKIAKGKSGGNLVDSAVRVSENGDFADTEYVGSGAKLSFTNAPDFRRIPGFSLRPKAAGFSARGGDEISVDTFSRVPGQRAPETKRFVIGMRENSEQFEFLFHCVPLGGSSRDLSP
jgi:hypothetical protein